MVGSLSDRTACTPQASSSSVDAVFDAMLAIGAPIATRDADQQIEIAAAGLSSNDLGTAVAAAGTIAQLVAGRALAGTGT